MKMNKLKFNILDVSIILLLIFFIVASVVKYNFKSTDSFTVSKNHAVISVQVIDTEKNLTKNVFAGDKIYFADTDTEIGTILSVVNKNNKSFILTETGYDEVFSDELYRVLIRIEADVYTNENGTFTANNRFIAPGCVFDLETKNSIFTATITSINIK